MEVAKGVSTRLFVVFAVLLVSIAKTRVDAGSYDLVFLTNIENPAGIYVAPADTFNFTLLPGLDSEEHVLRPVAIGYDPIDRMVYWTDVQHSSISRALVDGTGSVVVLRDVIQAEGITLDVENRVMYWTDAGSSLIEWASLDGQNRTVLVNLTSSTEEVKPRPIILDVGNGYLFWADWGSSPKIERANTDGTSRMVLVNTGLLFPIGLELDLQGGRLYWCDPGVSAVESVDLHGQNRINHATFVGLALLPFGIARYQENLFWTDGHQQIVNLTFGPPPSVEVISFNNFSYAFGIHIHSDTFQDHSCVDSTPCGVGERCRQFHNHYQCVCQDGPAGENCQLANNPCGAAPCSNGGSCFLSTSRDNEYFCQCRERYFGTNCEIYVDPCLSDPCWNGGTCDNSTAEFTCTCPPDFIGLFCESQSHPYDLVFVANLDPPGIYIAPTDTFNFTLIPGLDGSHGNISRPVAIDYDPEENMVYWTDVTLNSLNRAFLDGTGVEVLFTDLQIPDGLTLDVENRVMYWTDTGSDLIERAALDGQGRSVVLNLTDASLGTVGPRGIVLDPANSFLYWTDWGSAPKIERCGTNGLNRRVLIGSNLGWPNGIALDLEGGRMYWCDAYLDIIEYSDLMGQGRTVLVDFTVFDIHPFDLFVYHDFVYWSDWTSQTILRVETAGRHVGVHGSESFGQAGGIHVFKANSCHQTVCLHEGICLVLTHTYYCICAPGYHGRNCENDNLPPTFTTGCPGNIVHLADNSQRLVPVSWPDLDASDPSTPLLWNSTHQPGDMFSVGGVTMVTYTVKDQAGNAASCNFNVTVIGVGIECPSDVTAVTGPQDLDANVPWALPDVTFNGPQIPVMFYVGMPPTEDTSDGEVRVYSDYQPNDAFLVGVTRVTYLVQGLGTQCHFDVIVRDVYPPTFTTGCPGNIVHVVDNNQNVISVSWPALSASDPNTPLLWSSTHQPGDMFSVGRVTMVTYTVTDQAGNAASCNFNVTVIGVGLQCPSNVTVVTGPGVSDALVSWTLPNVTFNGPPKPVMFYVGMPPTQDTSDTDVEVHVYSYYQPNTVFNVGVTRVAYVIQGLGTQCHFHVMVIQVDNDPPVISGCPGDVIIPIKPSPNPVAYTWVPPVIFDNAGTPDVTFECQATNCSPTGSGTFSVGVTIVAYVATDPSGNQNTCQFKITVTEVDLVCPVDFMVYAEPGLTYISVDWMEPVLTGWNGPTNFTSNFSPGVNLEIGSYDVSYRQQFQNGLILSCTFSVGVIGFCPADNTIDIFHGILKWLPTQTGTTAESFERCPLDTTKAGNPLALRNCSIAPLPFYFRWENHVPLTCGDERNDVSLDDVEVVNVTKGNVEEVVEFLANQTSESSENAENVDAVSTILMNIVGAGSGSVEVTKLVVQTVSNVIMTTSQNSDPQTPNANAGSSSAIVQSVEEQVSLTLRQEGPVRIQQDTIHVEAVRLDPALVGDGLTFVSAPTQQTGQPSPPGGSLAGTEVSVVNASEVPQDVIASIQLPANIVQLIQGGNDNNSQPLQVSFIVYAGDTLFKSALIREGNGSSIRVGGSVVSLTVEDAELVNLTEPVVIQFKAPSLNETEKNRTQIKCVFWDFDLNDKVGDWSTAGCVLAKKTNATVSCNCSHATNFAILVDVKGQISEELRAALDVISLVGCVLSVVSLGITLIVYLSFKKLRNGKSRQIFIHFCFSLLFLYIVFLTGIDNAKGSGGGCVFVAALLHYFTLSSMMWMAVEARNMYVSTVKVFPEDTPRYMLKAGLIAWGSPLIVLVITLAAAHGQYGHDPFYCFLKPGLVLYLAQLAPIGLILLHNIITFVLVMRSLLKVKEASRSQQISRRLQNAVGISALMGLAWIFGFLAIDTVAQPGEHSARTFAFQLIFCLANAFQGLIIFIMFVVRREEVRKELHTALVPLTNRICCGRTCQLKAPLRKDKSYNLPMLSETVSSSQSTAQTVDYEMSITSP